MEHNTDDLACALISLLRGEPADVLDWQSFRSLVIRHGVVGLVYPLINSEEGKSALFRDYADQASNTIAHMALFSFLRENAPPFLAMKGASLIARGLYLPQERPLLDMDILVRPRDIPLFVKILSASGFSEVISSRKGVVLHRGRINIDLHLYPVARELFIPPGKLWARSSEGFLSPEDELLVISVHEAKSSFTFGPRLIWKQDAERLLTLVDLEKALWLARSVGLESCLTRFLRARDIDIVRGKRNPGRFRKLSLAWRAGANKGQKFLCVSAAAWERIGRGR
ncbi:MAG: nucleotidyltransferase family protein [candidate division WOR-3 bacterium]